MFGLDKIGSFHNIPQLPTIVVASIFKRNTALSIQTARCSALSTLLDYCLKKNRFLTGFSLHTFITGQERDLKEGLKDSQSSRSDEPDAKFGMFCVYFTLPVP